MSHKTHSQGTETFIGRVIILIMFKRARFFLRQGFTLIELLVVVSLIAILAGVIYVNFNDSQKTARDVQRQSDLRDLQTAIELYKNKYGRYPAGCSTSVNNWSGQLGTSFQCPDGTGQYIVDLAPEFIPVLPIDPRAVSGQQGYAYVTNTDGTVFKLIAMNVVEGETVDYSHPMKRCDFAGGSGGDPTKVGLCTNIGGACLSGNESFQKSYAVWGGFATMLGAGANVSYEELRGATYTVAAKRNFLKSTTDIICK